MLMKTYTGLWVDPLQPNAVAPIDVAYGLAAINRYTGQTLHLQTVARHSIDLAYQFRPNGPMIGSKAQMTLMLQALCHDAHEAYFGDISRPVKEAIKKASGEDWLRRLEDRCQQTVLDALRVPTPLDPEVKRKDQDCWKHESTYLWTPEPRDPMRAPTTREKDAEEWLRLYYDLMDKVHGKGHTP